MLIGKYNNREQFWEDLDNLKAKGNYRDWETDR